MSKRLLASAIVATLMMASTAMFTATTQSVEQTASIPVMAGG